MRSEIRREAISLLLGDLREFQDCTGQLHVSGLQTQETMTRLLEAVEKRVANNLESKEQEKFKKAKSIFHLLSECVEPKYINMFSDYKWRVVRQEMWDDWLKTCWGHDHDTLSMLSLLPPITKYKNFIRSVEKLPIIQSPAPGNPEQQLTNLVDYCTHSGTLYPPSLQWAQWINTGIRYQEFILNKRYSSSNLNGYELSKDKIDEHRKLSRLSHRYLSVARVLLGAMLDFYVSYQSISLDDDVNNHSLDDDVNNHSLDDDVNNHSLDDDVNNCSNLMEKVSDILYKDNFNIQKLEPLLKEYLPELNNSSSNWLTKSIKPGSFQKKVYSFLEEERKCIAYLLWKAKNKQLGIFIQEVLFAYLRCKGAWFQLNSGNNLKNLNPSEYVLLKTYDLLIVDSDEKYCDLFHDPMSEAVRKFYRDTNSPTKVELRLPFMGKRIDVKKNIEWLESIYEQVQCDFVLTFPYNFNDKNQENQKKSYDDYIQHVNELKKSFRICGFNLVGNHKINDYDKYTELLKYLRNKIISETGNESCFVSYHLDKGNNAFSLKKICELLTIVKMDGLKKGDRISYDWSLSLRPDTSNQKDGKEEMYWEEWSLIEARLDELKHGLNDEQKKAVYQLKKTVIYEDNKAYLDARIMCDLAPSLQPLFQKELIEKDILLEVCPTSSWRIAGISSATQNPVNSWIKARGEVRVGTDSPAIFPCTIESEYYSLQRLMEQSNMPEAQSRISEVTSQISSEEKKYLWDVFLSHSSADKEKVREVAKKLTDENLKVWLDEEQIDVDDGIVEKIEEGLTYSKRVIVCLSPQFKNSKWCRKEYHAPMNGEISRQDVKRVITLVIEDVMYDDIPAILTDKYRVKYNSPEDWNKLLKKLRSPVVKTTSIN